MKMKAIIILLISLFIGLQMPTAKGQKLPTRIIVVNGVSFNMIHVEGGTFMMGSTDEQESGAEEDEFPHPKELLHRRNRGDPSFMGCRNGE